MDSIRSYIVRLQNTLDLLSLTAISEAVSILYEARLAHRQVFIMGNGGSASTATHFVCDLAKNIQREGWPDFRVLGLSDNMALMTAYANDEGYENVFARQLASFVQSGDVVIGISTSGKSANVLEAIELANERGATTIGFTGFDGGNLARLVDTNIHVPSNCVEQVEDIHLMLGHLICTVLQERTGQAEHLAVEAPALERAAV